MADVRGLNAVIDALNKRAAAAKADDCVVAVGYEAAYAVYVHENIEMKWRGKPRRKPAKGVYWGPTGQAKFLEQPARQLSTNGTVGEIVRQAMEAGQRLPQALMLAGLRLQRDSQKLVPIDTGNLKNSAFTTLERGG